MVRSRRDTEGSERPAEETGLLAFPRPSLAVDIAVLTVAPLGEDGAPRLAVLVLRRDAEPHAGRWGLPGSFVRERERLSTAVLRTLAGKCAIRGLDPRQLHVFDDPSRDDRGWVVSVAHTDVVPVDRLAIALGDSEDLALAPVLDPAADPVRLDLPGRQRNLPFDHDEIVDLAVDDLRRRYQAAPDPAGLVPEPFTLLELRRTHEAVLGEPLQKDTFRRQVIAQLTEVEDVARGVVGRPARLFRRADPPSRRPRTR